MLLFHSLRALAGSISLWYEWKQVSLGLQDSSRYCNWSKLCCSPNSLDLSPKFQLFQSSFQTFGDCSKCVNYNWYYSHLHIPQLPQFFGRVLVLVSFCTSLIFPLSSTGMSKFTIWQVLFFFFLLIITRPALLVGVRRSVSNSKFLRILCLSLSSRDAGLCIYHLVAWSNFNFLHNS